MPIASATQEYLKNKLNEALKFSSPTQFKNSLVTLLQVPSVVAGTNPKIKKLYLSKVLQRCIREEVTGQLLGSPSMCP